MENGTIHGVPRGKTGPSTGWYSFPKASRENYNDDGLLLLWQIGNGFLRTSKRSCCPGALAAVVSASISSKISQRNLARSLTSITTLPIAMRTTWRFCAWIGTTGRKANFLDRSETTKATVILSTARLHEQVSE